jgi:hypothetical protein
MKNEIIKQEHMNKYKRPIIAKNEIKICIENNKDNTDVATDLICKYIAGLLRDAKNQYERK